MSQLPPGWELKKFTDVFDINGGTQPPKSEFISEPKEGYIRLLQIRDFGAKPVPTYIPDNGKRRTCTEDDILIGRYGASVGRICTGMSGAYNVALAKVAKPDYIDTGYLKYFLKSDVFQRPLSMLSRSAQNGFNKKDLSTFDFYQPPLEDQKRIADKLDSVLAKVEGAQARLDKIPTILKRFRQSVLAAATSGELTKDWREENSDSVNTLAEFFIAEYDGKDLAELPQGWGYVSFKDAADIKSNLTDPKLTPDAIHLAPNHIEANTGKILELVTVEQDGVKSNKHQFYAGQIIYSKIRPYLNKVCAVDFEGLCSADMYPIEAKVNREYLLNVMLSDEFVNYTSQQQGRVVLPKINQKALNKIPVPVPPEAEQLEISRLTSELLAKAEVVEKQYNAAKARLNKLNQSILARAFKGDLFLPLSESTAIKFRIAGSTNSSENTASFELKTDLISDVPDSSTVDNTKIDQVSAAPANDEDLEFEKNSEVLKLLRTNKKRSRSVQEIFDTNELNTFETIDNIFIELKKLLKLNLIEQLGNGINTKFKAK
ncbi:restriction endonuclease subunit S [Psychrobium sp. MM17-31]|uniref:restriction endonuclease subunit S n=1 Tax=Psychrobium sp. MM17-31 TaxID=2917758 RepID=UPI001EF5AA54|nr:restriction endonuclease subunit S [Psychrobium sp. MM17-31]MCG7532728.1 restriction endonuclease subunit S [Psychrobium sp. MM17-31]